MKVTNKKTVRSKTRKRYLLAVLLVSFAFHGQAANNNRNLVAELVSAHNEITGLLSFSERETSDVLVVAETKYISTKKSDAVEADPIIRLYKNDVAITQMDASGRYFDELECIPSATYKVSTDNAADFASFQWYRKFPTTSSDPELLSHCSGSECTIEDPGFYYVIGASQDGAMTTSNEVRLKNPEAMTEPFIGVTGPTGSFEGGSITNFKVDLRSLTRPLDEDRYLTISGAENYDQIVWLYNNEVYDDCSGSQCFIDPANRGTYQVKTYIGCCCMAVSDKFTFRNEEVSPLPPGKTEIGSCDIGPAGSAASLNTPKKVGTGFDVELEDCGLTANQTIDYNASTIDWETYSSDNVFITNQGQGQATVNFTEPGQNSSRLCVEASLTILNLGSFSHNENIFKCHVFDTEEGDEETEVDPIIRLYKNDVEVPLKDASGRSFDVLECIPNAIYKISTDNETEFTDFQWYRKFPATTSDPELLSHCSGSECIIVDPGFYYVVGTSEEAVMTTSNEVRLKRSEDMTEPFIGVTGPTGSFEGGSLSNFKVDLRSFTRPLDEDRYLTISGAENYDEIIWLYNDEVFDDCSGSQCFIDPANRGAYQVKAYSNCCCPTVSDRFAFRNEEASPLPPGKTEIGTCEIGPAGSAASLNTPKRVGTGFDVELEDCGLTANQTIDYNASTIDWETYSSDNVFITNQGQGQATVNFTEPGQNSSRLCVEASLTILNLSSFSHIENIFKCHVFDTEELDEEEVNLDLDDFSLTARPLTLDACHGELLRFELATNYVLDINNVEAYGYDWQEGKGSCLPDNPNKITLPINARGTLPSGVHYIDIFVSSTLPRGRMRLGIIDLDTYAYSGAFEVYVSNDEPFTLASIPAVQGLANFGDAVEIDLDISREGNFYVSWDDLSSSPTFRRIYVPGTYTATVREACVDEIQTVTTTVIDDFSITLRAFNETPVPNQTVNFEVTIDPAPQQTVAYSWDFEDGTTISSGSSTEGHAYSLTGLKTPEVVVKTGFNGFIQRTVSTNVFVSGEGALTILPLKPDPCSLDPEQFKTDVDFPAGASYTWDFGDPTSNENSSTQVSPLHLYEGEDGNYPVTVSVDFNGNTSTGSLDYFHQPFVVDLGGDQFIAPGQELVLDAGIENADAYLWSDGETLSQTFTITEEGTYEVRVLKNGCDFEDGILVTLATLYLSPSKACLAGDEVETLQAFGIADNSTVKWQIFDESLDRWIDFSPSQAYAGEDEDEITYLLKNTGLEGRNVKQFRLLETTTVEGADPVENASTTAVITFLENLICD